jgi:inner membrane protein
MTEPRALVPSLSRSAGLRVAVLGFLVVVLLLPLSRVLHLVRERSSRQVVVSEEIAQLWGKRQTILGPILAVRWETKQLPAALPGTIPPVPVSQLVTLHLLPENLEWRGEVVPHVRYRGLFEVVVYQTRLRAEGRFRLPDGGLPVPPGQAELRRASLDVGISDVRGLQESATLEWRGGARSFEPGIGAGAVVCAGIHVDLDIGDGLPALGAPGQELPFSFELSLRGSEELRFLPAGKDTGVTLASPWTTPSFVGAFLPRTREIGGQGFTASWRVPHFGRGYPQSWWDEEVALDALEDTSFGVGLVLPADGYQQTERSVKYAVLFIVLTFATFYLLEVTSPVRLHPLQYLLVGCALCLFYLLLLALSEHTGFALAYLLGAGATVTLIAAYAAAILRLVRWGALIFGCLGALYGYLYVILRAEDLALLLGALGLFAILALLMYLTRELDWYELRFRREDENSPLRSS